MNYCKCGCGKIVKKIWHRGHCRRGAKFSKQHITKLSKAARNRKLSEECKKKISNSLKGNIPWNKNTKNCFSIETLKKMKDIHTGRKQSKDEINKRMKKLLPIIKSKEYREKMSKALIGKNKGNILTQETKNKISKTLKGRVGSNRGFKHSMETKYKLRMARIQQIKFNKNKHTWAQIGKYETQILDNLEKCFYPYKIERQFLVRGFFLDGYCSALNLAIEIDEPHHLKEENIKRDIKRQQEIEEHLKCKFLRIPIEV